MIKVDNAVQDFHENFAAVPENFQPPKPTKATSRPGDPVPSSSTIPSTVSPDDLTSFTAVSTSAPA
jgi:hypothetical protein